MQWFVFLVYSQGMGFYSPIRLLFTAFVQSLTADNLIVRSVTLDNLPFPSFSGVL